MWMFFMDMLAHPIRSLRTWVVVVAVVIILLLALANAGVATQSMLTTVIVLLLIFGVFVKVRMQAIGKLIAVAILLAGAVSIVHAVVGDLPLMMLGGGLVFGVSVWVRRGAPGLHRAPRSRGAHWATLPELRLAGFLTAHGWPLGTFEGKVVRLPEKRERESVLMTAATGAGKTSIGVIPVLIEEASRSADHRRHLVIVDPKSELTDATLPTLARSHRVLLWDPSDPDSCTTGFDPLSTMPKVTDESFVGEVKQLAQAFFWSTRGGEKTSDPFWITQPRSLMEALFLAFIVAHPEGTFVELAVWARSLKMETFQTMLDRSPNESVRACAETLRAVGMSEKTSGPIFGDVLQRFDVLDDPRVRRSMAGPTWSFEDEPTALYLRVSAQDAQRLGPLLTLSLGQVYRELTKAAARNPGNKLARECRIIIDEFGNLPRILGVETALATLRSYGVGHYVCVQSSTQLVHQYGRELAATIQDNLVTKLMLNGAAADDAQAFSARCGEITEYHKAHSWAGGSLLRSANLSYAPDRRPLVTPAEIIHGQGQVLVSTRGLSPIRLTARRYYMDPAVVRRLEEDRRQFHQQHGVKAPELRVSPPDETDVRGERDVPPPGCSKEEWDAAAKSLRCGLWSMEDDLFALVTGRVADLDQVREKWRANPSRSSPARYGRITAAERAKSPAVATYVDELALRLELRHEDDQKGTN